MKLTKKETDILLRNNFILLNQNATKKLKEIYLWLDRDMVNQTKQRLEELEDILWSEQNISFERHT